MSMKTLTKPELKTALKSLTAEWKLQYKDTKLTKTIPTRNFLEAVLLLSQITVHAEVLQHHPDVQVSYQQLKITLTTHDAKGITHKDIALAQKIDQL